MYHQDELFYCHVDLKPKTKTFENLILNIDIKKYWQTSHHLILKADESFTVNYYICSPQVTRCTWLEIILQNNKLGDIPI